VDLGQRRELNNGAGDALTRAVELVVTPIILGAIGWWLDSIFGTKPVIALVLFLFTLGYLVWKLYLRYDADMRAHEMRVLGQGGGHDDHRA
jgi:F0F1-type ATP synthase assembly protein I